MLELTKNLLKNKWNVSDKIIHLAEISEKETLQTRLKVKEAGAYNQLKVLTAMKENSVSEYHLGGTTGYGFHDDGRDTLDKVFAQVFGAEKALVRLQFVSGTHALSSVLFGNLRPGDKWLSVVGTPYDTMIPVINGGKEWKGSLKEWGIDYSQTELKEDHSFDFDAIFDTLKEKIKLVYIQRSLGYTWRPSITLSEMEKVIKFIKEISPETIVMVDNCYGEFAETIEPTEIGADITGGSLIKNAGGGIAPAGGYITGKAELVENAAIYLTSPGIGRDEGATLGMNRLMYQGLFAAPLAVSSAMEGAIWASHILFSLGFEVMPEPNGIRTDIIQGIKFGLPEKMKAFCKGIQNSSPVDSSASPEPVDMPGYRDPIIMAGGTFIQGSSIELSCDGPLRPPYSAYLQGGLSFWHVQFGVMNALSYMEKLKMLP